VKDNGIGISEDMSDIIFEPFRRLHTRSEFTGTGLGLSISKRIVETHNGEIWLDHNTDKKEGSLFKIKLPLA
jgi:signal transduction histidine kinase